jgi:hypothetical protein
MKINCEVVDGLMPMEKVARIKNADGKVEEVAVSTQHISDNALIVSEIGRKDDRVLVELPSESSTGHWRVWVKAASVGR